MASILDSSEIRKSVHPISVDDYHRLNESGAIDHSVELIEGIILNKMSKSPLHCFVRSRLQELISKILGEGKILRIEEPLTCSAVSEPEPDLAVVTGEIADFRDSHPTSADLVIEVAVTSEARDREKAAIYAAAGISEYWIVLPESRSIVVMHDPDPTSETFLRVDEYNSERVTSEVLTGFSVKIDELL